MVINGIKVINVIKVINGNQGNQWYIPAERLSQSWRPEASNPT